MFDVLEVELFVFIRVRGIAVGIITRSVVSFIGFRTLILRSLVAIDRRRRDFVPLLSAIISGVLTPSHNFDDAVTAG